MSATFRKGDLAAALFGVLFLATVADAATAKQDHLLSQSGKTVTQRDGKIVVTVTGTLETDQAIIKEAVSQFVANNSTVGLGVVVYVVRNANGSVVATAEHWNGGDGAIGLDSTPPGPPPPEPPPPPAGTPPGVGSVSYVEHLNGYTRNTTYSRDVTPDPGSTSGYDDGPWYPSFDQYQYDGGGGTGQCKPDAPANCPAPDSANSGS